ncbi:hypothetical protein ACFL2H_07850 [Planctomycetota bacterium]
MPESTPDLSPDSPATHSADIEPSVDQAEASPDQSHRLSRLDPKRFHGAWIFLCESVGAGALVGGRNGVEPALLAGTACAGVFLIIAAASTGFRGKGQQVLTGVILALVAPLFALLMGADSRFVVVGALAILPAGATVVLARRFGFLSPIVLATGVAALAVAAPMAAVAGGASMSQAAILFSVLWALFYWRSLRVASLVAGNAPWNAQLLRTRGLREAAFTAACSLVIAIVLRATA